MIYHSGCQTHESKLLEYCPQDSPSQSLGIYCTLKLQPDSACDCANLRLTGPFKMSSLTVQDYHIGWICALNEELTAAIAMLDEEYEIIAGQDPKDHNSYVLGRIHQHNVAIACMPEGVDGLVPAATVAKDMARAFPALPIGLMVGIGGGIPNLSQGIDIRLGDVVVSKPEKTWGGVVQYDKGKAENGSKFIVKGQLNQPPTLLLQTLTQLRARHAMRPSKVSDYINEVIG
jgi:hypothetical protein